MNPLYFIARGLCIIIDRLYTEGIQRKKCNDSNTYDLNKIYCYKILELLLRDKAQWKDRGMSQVPTSLSPPSSLSSLLSSS